VDHKWLEDFIMLAHVKSFSKAAELRHITQPQFSRRIRSLEMWAGSDLINRACVPLSLTPAGEELLGTAMRAVSSLADMRARLRQTQVTAGWLRLATGRTLSRTAVPQWFAQSLAHAGHFQLKLMTGSIQEGITALEQGACDLLLSYAHPRLPMVLDEAHFESIAFSTDELVAVSAPSANGKAIHALPGSLKKPVPWLTYAPTLALAQILQEGLSRQAGLQAHLSPLVESDFAESLHEQALQGAGMAWLPRSLVHADLTSGRLVLADASSAPIRFETRMYRARAYSTELAERVWRSTASLAI
jgi:LysR family transcriptional regulator, hypochlorite-specific transcription factor HypT